MLDQPHRFHGLNSLSYAYRQGQTVRGSQLSLKYAVNKRRKTYRVAVVVSRKVDKSAVVRNRIRRRIYEVVRAYSPNPDQPYDLVFTVYSPSVGELTPAQLKQLVVGQLKKAGLGKRQTTVPHAIVKTEE